MSNWHIAIPAMHTLILGIVKHLINAFAPPFQVQAREVLNK